MEIYPEQLPKPDVKHFAESAAIDPTLRSEMESGVVLTRSRMTKVPMKWEFKILKATTAQKEILSNFEIARRYGAEAFYWVHPLSGIQFKVRFGSLINYVYADNAGNWDLTITLVQV